jgi:hypothetical protein
MVIATDAEKTFAKIEYLFLMKTLHKLGIDEKILNLMKNSYKKPAADIVLSGKRPKTFF